MLAGKCILVNFDTSAVPWDWRLSTVWQLRRQILSAYSLNWWELYPVQAAALLLFSCQYWFPHRSWNCWFCWLQHSQSTSNQGNQAFIYRSKTTFPFKYQHILIYTGIRAQWLGINLQEIWGSKHQIPITAQNSGTQGMIGHLLLPLRLKLCDTFLEDSHMQNIQTDELWPISVSQWTVCVRHLLHDSPSCLLYHHTLDHSPLPSMILCSQTIQKCNSPLQICSWVF